MQMVNGPCVDILVAFQKEPLTFDLDLSTLDPKVGEVMIKIKEVRTQVQFVNITGSLGNLSTIQTIRFVAAGGRSPVSLEHFSVPSSTFHN